MTLESVPSVDQIHQDLTLLARAHTLLYRKVKHVKVQIYSALVMLALLAALIFAFSAAGKGPDHGLKVGPEQPALAVSARVVEASPEETSPAGEWQSGTSPAEPEAEWATSASTASEWATEPSTYSVRVEVNRASVPLMDYIPLKQKSDTYCVVYVDWRRVGRTAVIYDDSTPSWQYSLPQTFSLTRHSSIAFELFDKDFDSDDKIGLVSVSLGSLIDRGQVNRETSLFYGKGHIHFTVSIE